MLGIDTMRFATVLVLVVVAGVLSAVHAQTASISPPSGTKTLAATLKVYVFPGAGQPAAQQSVDETECYNWAVQETGADPFHIANQAAEQEQQAAQQQQQAQQSTSGSALKGAVGGAAGGAIIGAIAGNAGKGAAIGAGVGAIGNRARAEGQAQKASQQAAQQAQAAAKTSAAQMTEFRKAFSACLEAKKYTSNSEVARRIRRSRCMGPSIASLAVRRFRSITYGEFESQTVVLCSIGNQS